MVFRRFSKRGTPPSPSPGFVKEVLFLQDAAAAEGGFVYLDNGTCFFSPSIIISIESSTSFLTVSTAVCIPTPRVFFSTCLPHERALVLSHWAAQSSAVSYRCR